MNTYLQQIRDEDSLRIAVVDAAHTYYAEQADFSLHYGQPAPELPEGALHRLYIPQQLHCVSDGENQTEGGPLQWDEGDAIIAALPQLLTAQTQAQQAAEEDAQQDAQSEGEELPD